MKRSLVVLTLALLALTFDVVGQNAVTITPKKVTYTRKGRVEKYKRTFPVRYPIVSGALSPAVKKRLQNTISYWRVFEMTLAENLEETGLDSLDYKVNYNRNGILDITLIDEHSGAYPDTSFANIVVDLRTGKQVKFADAFTPNAKLVEMVNQKLAADKRESLDRLGEEKDLDADGRSSLKEMINNLEFTMEDFGEFHVSDKGVTILYDAEFPHAIQALQPDGSYLFTFAEMRPFIKKDGLLARFVR